MNETVIKAEGVGKSYVIGLQADAKHITFREVIADRTKRLVSKISRPQQRSIKSIEEFWALKDVSFEVNRGERLGIIGRNGAGKSTLLKALSRITEPTTGRISIRGQVASLLEVGTGFHPELTGRENIFLNGAILGMSRAEIRRKFDEIVDFAEVARFLDTPVKRFSSGMYVRLAFAVAAHLEPEILVIDEVLAVGDAAFQKKCLGKMSDVAREGRTVLFVSHNMGAILNLCNRAILLEAGRIVIDSDTTTAVDGYLHTITAQPQNTGFASRTDRQGTQRIKFVSFGLLSDDDKPIQNVMAGKAVKIAVNYESSDATPRRGVQVAIAVHGKYDENLFHLSTDTLNHTFDVLPPKGTFVCCVPCMPLQPGHYSFNLFMTEGKDIADWIRNAGVIEMVSGDFFGSGKMPPVEQGPFLVQHRWELVS